VAARSSGECDELSLSVLGATDYGRHVAWEEIASFGSIATARFEETRKRAATALV
jgi:hypothetical protein